MRYGIFSDIHSNLEALDSVIDSTRKDKIDYYLCAGDVVGYAVNPNECVKTIQKISCIAIAGNHDQASVGLYSLGNFNEYATQVLVWTQENLDSQSKNFLRSLPLVFENQDLALAHGTLDNPQEFNYLMDVYSAEGSFSLMRVPVCFVGHTHVPGFFVMSDSRISLGKNNNKLVMREGAKYIVNLGSVGQPRDNNPKAAYCIYDTDALTLEIKRVRYNSELARKKILDAGLSQFLGDRLLVGV